MATVMTASEFVKKLKDIEKNYKTLYVMGSIGDRMTAANKAYHTGKNGNDYNKSANRVKMINAASEDTWGFDCSCVIKAILWGWNGSKTKAHGGAVYQSNGVQDLGANYLIQVCNEVSTNFANVAVGELLWCKGHVGIYIGNGLAIECTPAWKNCVQITAVKNIGTKAGYNARTWTKHGKLPYIDYNVKATPTKKPTTTTTTTKVDVATKRDGKLTGKYKVTHSNGLHVRTGAGTSKKSLKVLPKDAVVNNYGYYNVASNGVKWLYVQTSDGLVGYCSSAYLKKI